ncbi:MAG: limonene,2-epoxide hydrolase [Mycobacterium sp.]|jgi:limonene-1,2-epoxide hydrolase|nr:limonene,2-epoxide hydrolase [Mycobacterium sp.]
MTSEQTADTSTETDNIRTVTAFLNALRESDLDTAGTLLDDNLVYQNVGFPTIRGARRTITLFRPLTRSGLGFDVKIHRTAASGATVMNERTDVLILGPVRLQFWVCGVFEVRGGRVTLWRDYFDMFDMLKATVRGLAGTVVPALRPTL